MYRGGAPSCYANSGDGGNQWYFDQIYGQHQTYGPYSGPLFPSWQSYSPRSRRGRSSYKPRNVKTIKQTVVEQDDAGSSQQQKSHWYKVTITLGKEVGKETVLKTLSNHLGGPLMPYCFTFEQNGSATFLVVNKSTADSIASSKQLSGPNGETLLINVESTEAPYTPLDAETEQVLKKVLKTRYDGATRTLNLSSFSSDSALQEHQSSNLCLKRSDVLLTVVKLVGNELESARNTESLDVSDNQLDALDCLSNLVYRLPNVTSLIMHNNQIDKLSELEKISDWNITKLDLSDNPLSSQYQDKSAYVSDLQRLFPKITELDKESVVPEPQIGSDADEASLYVDEASWDAHEEPVPVVSQSLAKSRFLVNNDMQSTIRQFLEHYYTIFDIADIRERQQLLEAYDEDATFTATALDLTQDGPSERDGNWYDLARDGQTMSDKSVSERYRAKLVRHGKSEILSYLCQKFPRTSHIFETFIIDVSYTPGNVLCVNLSGAFREISIVDQKEYSSPIRYFNRIFVLLQTEKGKLITNDGLFISTLNEEQYGTYLNKIKEAAAQAESESVTTDVSLSTPPTDLKVAQDRSTTDAPITSLQ